LRKERSTSGGWVLTRRHQKRCWVSFGKKKPPLAKKGKDLQRCDPLGLLKNTKGRKTGKSGPWIRTWGEVRKVNTGTGEAKYNPEGKGGKRAAVGGWGDNGSKGNLTTSKREKGGSVKKGGFSLWYQGN